MRRGLAVVLFSIVPILLLSIGMAFKAIFEEPGARRVSSLVTELGCHSILAVFAHPDDEILVAATLADAARRGCDVRTVTATRGERGGLQDFSGDQAQLVRVRGIELRRFGKELGLREQIVWDFPDSGLSAVSLQVLVDSIGEAIHRYAPDLVLTMDPVAGFTGHPDHRRIGEAATLAARHVSASLFAGSRRSAPRWLAYVVFPRRAAVLVPTEELRRRLRGQPPAHVAAAGNLGVKLLGMRMHATQQRYFPPAWLRSVLYRLYDREHFSLTSLEHHP